MPQAFAKNIFGYWKLATEPDWVEINLDPEKGAVVRNDKFPDQFDRVP